MKKQKYAIMVSALVALILAVASGPAQATTLDTTTKGNWIGTYGADGYILNAYSQSATFGSADKANDLTLPVSYVSDYSYVAAYATYMNASQSLDAKNLQDPGNPTGPRNGIVTYGAGALTVSLDLLPNAKPFQLAVYNQYTFTGGTWSFNIDLTYGSDPAIIATAPISDAQEVAGTWAVFNLVPNGQTLLNITWNPLAPYIPNPGYPGSGDPFFTESAGFNAIMFDGGGLFIPEPSTVMLLGMGGFIVWLRRRNRQS